LDLLGTEDVVTLVRRPWSEQDIAQIKKLAGKLSLRELADKLDRSDEATRAKASKLGVCLQSEAPAVPGEKPVAAKAQTQTATLVETVVAPAAIERALSIYEQLQQRDQSVIVQARKILTQFIFGLVDQGEQDEQRLTVGGLAHLKAIERDHAIKSAYEASEKDGASSSP
jgi:hypothetical protein